MRSLRAYAIVLFLPALLALGLTPGCATEALPIPAVMDNSPPVLTMPQDEGVSPSTWVSLSATATDEDDDELSYEWSQDSGPSVDLGNTSGLLVQFIAPDDVGTEQIIELSLTVSDGVDDVTGSVQITVTPASVKPFGFEDGHSSSLEITSSSLIHVNTLARQFDELTIDLASSDGANLDNTGAPFFIYLNSEGGVAAEVTDMFSYSAPSMRLSLKPGRVGDFRSELDDEFSYLLISADDDQGRSVALVLTFYYGSNSIEGKLVDDAGAPLAKYAGETLTAFSFTVGANRTTAIRSGGAFEFDDLPTDVYEITLFTNGGAYGHDVVPILSGGTTVETELIVDPSLDDSRTFKSFGNASRHVPVKIYKDNGSDHRRAPLPEPRLDPADPGGGADLGSHPSKGQSAKFGSSVSASSGPKDTKVEKKLTVEIPQGQESITLRWRVDSSEYPNYTEDSSKYDDKFGFLFEIKGPSGRIDQWKGHGNVNAQHAALAPDGKTDWQSRSWSVASHTKDHAISVIMIPWAINVGDSAMATTVTLEAEDPPFKITDFRHVAGLNPGENDKRRHIGIPRDKGTALGWSSTVKFQPKDAELISLTLTLKHGTESIVVEVFDPLQLEPMNNGQGTLLLVNGFPEGVGLNRSLVNKVSLSAVLKAKVDGKEEETPETLMKTDKGTELVPLYDVGEDVSAARRYSERDTDLGGDGWARKPLRNWLTSSTNQDLIFNDCSMENGGEWPFLNGVSGKRHHGSHQEGTDVDVRYFGDNWSLNKNHNGAREQIVADARTALGGGFPPAPGSKQAKLADWILKNRARLDKIAADPAVQVIYVEKSPWTWDPLVLGKYPDGLDLLVQDAIGIGPLGKWTGKSAKVQALGDHEHHAHVRLFR